MAILRHLVSPGDKIYCILFPRIEEVAMEPSLNLRQIEWCTDLRMAWPNDAGQRICSIFILPRNRRFR